MSSGQRRIHLAVDGAALCGTATVFPSLSSDPGAEGSVCQKCQRAMERLLRPILADQLGMVECEAARETES